jgi:hypothetical protein
MIVDVPSDVQMAIKLRAIKGGMTTGAVVCEAVQKVFATELEEAKIALATQKPSTRRQKS